MPRQEELGDVLEAALLIAGRHAESCLRRGRWSLARMVEEDYMVLVMLDRADDGTRLALRYVESPFANPPVVVAGCLREALDGLVLPWDADPAEVGRYMQVVGHALAGYPD